MKTLLLLAALAAATNQATVTIERNATGTPSFEFATVPPPSTHDAAARATLMLLGGTVARNSGQLAALTDGAVPTVDDDPGANLFFSANSWGGRVRIDLGRVVDIARIHSYSWHPSVRGPQIYKIYGAAGVENGLDAEPDTKLDPPLAGWTLIAFVDSRTKFEEAGGQYGVSITAPSGSLGRFRYLLIDAFETEQDDPWGNTFYSELDVVER